MTSSPMDIDTPPTLPENRPGPCETSSDFVTRLPPSSSKAEAIGPWIYVRNPYYEKPEAEEIALFTVKGLEGLRRFESEEARLRLENDRKGASPLALARKVTPLRRGLEQWIFALARETGAVTGKWMMFPSMDQVDYYWKTVADATMRGELGIGAKVATDDGQDRTRLICVYTRDYADHDDVKRVLIRLRELDLVRKRERPIYYKCDAFTHLEIFGNNPYGLNASLFSSTDVMAGKI